MQSLRPHYALTLEHYRQGRVLFAGDAAHLVPIFGVRGADIVIWNPDREFVVEGARLEHRHKLTPYERETLSGVVEKTFLRGRKIYDDGPGDRTDTPLGHLLL